MGGWVGVGGRSKRGGRVGGRRGPACPQTLAAILRIGVVTEGMHKEECVAHGCISMMWVLSKGLLHAGVSQ